MPKVKPVGEPGTKTVMVTAEPGLTKEQIEGAAKALPELKEGDDATYNVVNALRDVALNASIEEAELKNLEVKGKKKKEATKMAEDKKKNQPVDEFEGMTEEEKKRADAFVKSEFKRLMELEKESKDDKDFIDRVKDNWDLMLGTAIAIVAVYFGYKIFCSSSDDSMAQDAVASGLELALGGEF